MHRKHATGSVTYCECVNQNKVTIIYKLGEIDRKVFPIACLFKFRRFEEVVNAKYNVYKPI